MKIPLVVIEWNDATTRNEGWAHVSEYAQATCLNILTTGFLIAKTKQHHVVVMSIDNNEHMKADYSMTIPNGCIKRVRRVGEYTIVGTK